MDLVKKQLNWFLANWRTEPKEYNINKTFSSWRELLYGVAHGSVLGPVLFNIYLNNLFLFFNEIDVCNFDNNTTPSTCCKNLAELSEKF